MVSLGVDTADWPALRVELLVIVSKGSGLVDAFSTFALGRVPKGAMFATTPCLSMPASAKDGLAGASWGSILWPYVSQRFPLAAACLSTARKRKERASG